MWRDGLLHVAKIAEDRKHVPLGGCEKGHMHLVDETALVLFDRTCWPYRVRRLPLKSPER